MKCAETLARVVLTIALITCMFNTAAARSPSVEVVESAAVGADPIYRTLSLELAQPLQVEIFGRAPSVDMGFYPFDSDPTRRSLLWNAFPDPPPAELFERNPSQAVKQPMQDGVSERNPSQAVKQPMQIGVSERMPTEAVRGPLDIECCGPTMHFNMKEAATTEIAIYSVNGRLVRRLTEALPSGESSLTWNGKDNQGRRVASAVYFARVQANGEAGKGKLVLIH